MSRGGQVWEQVGRQPGAFLVLWPWSSGGWRIMWLTGVRAGSLDRVGPEFEWDSGWWKQIA